MGQSKLGRNSRKGKNPKLSAFVKTSMKDLKWDKVARDYLTTVKKS